MSTVLVFNGTNEPVFIKEKNSKISPNKMPYELEEEIAVRYCDKLVIVSKQFLMYWPPVFNQVKKYKQYQTQYEFQESIRHSLQSNFIRSFKNPDIKENFDFLYSFSFDNCKEPIQRLRKSIRSIINQKVNICVCNTSKQCILNEIKDLGKIKYLHFPLELKEYNKPMTINIGVQELVRTPYFFISDIDLIYPSTFVENMAKYILLINPVRVLFWANNLGIETKSFGYSNLEKIFKQHQDQKRNPKMPAVGNGLIHLESFHKIGGFDEQYFGYGPEDVDFNLRISFINDLIEVDDSLVNTFHLFHFFGKKEDLFQKNRSIYENRFQELVKIKKEDFNDLKLIKVNNESHTSTTI